MVIIHFDSHFINVCRLGIHINVCHDAAGETHAQPLSKTFKFLSYNIWFHEELEMHNRMKALGNLIRLHSPDVICFQVSIYLSFHTILKVSEGCFLFIDFLNPSFS